MLKIIGTVFVTNTDSLLLDGLSPSRNQWAAVCIILTLILMTHAVNIGKGDILVDEEPILVRP